MPTPAKKTLQCPSLGDDFMDDNNERSGMSKEAKVMLCLFIFYILGSVAAKYIDDWNGASTVPNVFDPKIRSAVNREIEKEDKYPLSKPEVEDLAEKATIREINRRKGQQ